MNLCWWWCTYVLLFPGLSKELSSNRYDSFLKPKTDCGRKCWVRQLNSSDSFFFVCFLFLFLSANNSGYTNLMFTAHRVHLEVLRYLVGHGQGEGRQRWFDCSCTQLRISRGGRGGEGQGWQRWLDCSHACIPECYFGGRLPLDMAANEHQSAHPVIPDPAAEQASKQQARRRRPIMEQLIVRRYSFLVKYREEVFKLTTAMNY